MPISSALQVVSRLGEDWRHVAGRALGIAVELHLPSPRGLGVVTAFGRLRRWHSELIEMQSGQLGGDHVRCVTLMSPAGLRRNWVLFGILQTRIEKRTFAVTLLVPW